MKNETLFKAAELVASESNCVSHKVGTVITIDGRIVSTGYNGVPSGAKHCSDHAKENGWMVRDYKTTTSKLDQRFRNEHSKWSLSNEVHSEINAISYAAKKGIAIDGGVMFCTLSPCESCAKSIVASGIKELHVAKLYDRIINNDWREYLENNGVKVFIRGENDE